MKAERDVNRPTQPAQPVQPEPRGGMTETRGEEEFVEPEPQPDNTPVIPEDNDATTPHGEVQPDAGGDQTVEVEQEVEADDDLFTDADIEEQDMTPNQNDNITSNGTDAYTQKKLTGMLRRAIEKASQPVVERAITGRTTSWGLGGYATTVDYVVGSASKMGRQRALLARAMKANEMDDFDGGRRMGRLDRRVVHKLATRTSDAVFGLRTITEGYDTDVQILVDGSGSMSGNRILAASALALVVAQAASQVGVDCTAHVFTDKGLTVATKGKAKPIGKKFGYMFNQITGGTPLTENMLLAAELQHKRANGKRKILFVITDGDCDNGADVVKAAGQYIEGKGTEIANLHIGMQAMGLFRNEVAVDVRKVSEVGLKQLTAVLERGAN
jgi:Mg-chelatase subunit ChlD